MIRPPRPRWGGRDGLECAGLLRELDVDAHDLAALHLHLQNTHATGVRILAYSFLSVEEGLAPPRRSYRLGTGRAFAVLPTLNRIIFSVYSLHVFH